MKHIKTNRIDSGIRDNKKSSSISRRNLFTKKFNSDDSDAVKGPLQSNLGSAKYQSLLEQEPNPTDIYKRYLNKSRLKERTSKEPKGKVS